MRRPVVGNRRRCAGALAVLLLANGLGARVAAAQTDGGAAPGLPDPVRHILAHPTLQGARFGALAVELPSGRVLLSHRAEELFAPASVAKLFTTAAALDRLGPHFLFRTPLAIHGSRQGPRIEGDLWVLGRGAPDLVEERLWLAARALYEEGVRTITGDLVLDDRYFDHELYGTGWPAGNQVREAYHAPISALMANFAAVRAADGDGWEAVPDPPAHFGQVFAELLGRAGVQLLGRTRRPTPEEAELVPAPSFAGLNTGEASVPPPLTPLYVIESEPLGRLVMDINKFSNNIMAESLLKTLGAVEYGAPGTATKGLAVVARFLERKVGIPINSYVQADGSGLSRLDRFSPAQVIRLLEYAFHDFHIGPELVASLKLSGLDGWNPAPFKREPLAGELRVKSGHIKGVNTLAGFLHTGSGHVIAFCAMVNGHSAQQWQIDQRMAEIAQSLIQGY